MYPLNVEQFSALFTGEQIMVYFFLSVLNATLLFFASMKFILVLQQCGYKGRRYFKWLSNKQTPYLSRLMLLCMLAFLFFCVLNMCFAPLMAKLFGDDGKTVGSYIGFVSYLLFAILYINTESSVNAKVPLRKTKRIVRLCVTYWVVLVIITFAVVTLLNFLAFIIKSEIFAQLRYAIICGMPILLPYILFISYGINEPLERKLKKRY